MTSQQNNSPRILSLVVPIYKDADCVRPFLERVRKILADVQQHYGFDHEIIFVVDPSPDETEKVILEERRADPRVKMLTLSRRFGQQPAILAGIFNCRGHACVVLDVDLQDPPELILPMVEKHSRDGYNVVYAIRRKRHSQEPFLKKILTQAGYYWMNRLSSVEIPRNVGDYRLIDRKIIEELRKLHERNAFFRGLVPFVGFRQTGVEFDRDDRLTGETKYHQLWGSVSNGVNALVCFSNKLLMLSSIVGVVFFFLSIVLTCVVVYIRLFTDIQIENGITTLIILVLFTSGVQALLMGVLGSYVGRIYDETKARPVYIVDRAEGLEERT